MKKKQLLPKDLAARAEKVDPAKVEAEVLRIISAKPARLSPMDSQFVPGRILQAQQQAQFQAQAQAARLDMERELLQLEARTPWAGSIGGNPWGF